MAHEKRWVHRKMVGWYDPLQLLDTGVQVAVSELIGSRSDYRIIEGLSRAQEVFDYASEPEIWIDYVADLGDGWDSTYAIASTLAAEQFELPAGAGDSVGLALAAFCWRNIKAYAPRPHKKGEVRTEAIAEEAEVKPLPKWKAF